MYPAGGEMVHRLDPGRGRAKESPGERQTLTTE